jgi:hypothetical protein
MIKLTDKQNTTAPTATYPFGNVKDKNGAIPGTPVDKVLLGDAMQFFEKLMDAAGITPNGLPDNEYSGFQLFEALSAFTGGLKRKVISIGAWDMDADATKYVTHGLQASKIRNVSFTIFDDSGNLISINGTGYGASALPEAWQNAAYITTSITLQRTGAGTFDDPSFSSTSVNRGYIVIEYAP